MINRSEYERRIERLQSGLQENGLDGMLIAQNVDLYYLTGSMQTGYLLVPAKGEPRFMVRRSVARAQQESAWPVVPLGSLRELGQQLGQLCPDSTAGGNGTLQLAAEFDVLPVQQFQRLQQALPAVQWKDGSALIREVRMIKSEGELAKIRQAAQLVNEAFEDALGWLRPGLRELDIMSRIEAYMRSRGHIGVMRLRGFNQSVITGMIGAGEAAATPTYFDGPAGGLGLGAFCPQSVSLRPVGRDEPILIDIGCCVEGYVIDQTRTVVIGRLDEELEQAYEQSEAILRHTEAALKPGEVCEQLYADSLRLADEAGLAEHFMGYGADQVKFLGHGIGLEIDEWPVLARSFRYTLRPGMVLAIEPKFTFPGRGVVGIENSYAITEDGFEKLSVTREGLIRL
ncbi:Xaa-Pro aminopeptidase [Paenibacillus sp. UNCCL117]|uniref:M24 family metallopeptidase n=1 Tax=unclassified Paenibacillus TaxID=185978 RepID=UPI000884A697|nr:MULTISPECIES: Xaa-Pro peptidase family protein [unclassified Paenibacillus]SDE40629.1 Xaa-Pro aminopeptidase [Paenibacillus sp. cl123]SFW65372.1 Xaa-Pro aminopeptidase [Paenibacillus sp. UNCCL117]